ncbi:hypothetical protein ACBY01_13390 [Sphingomonas sp. ac-8]|uniref:hypothetical protein n=1 Tax=Sphingomonas sp. ac-8 TaxID=3242977 RepID=UPI003A8066BE
MSVAAPAMAQDMTGSPSGSMGSPQTQPQSFPPTATTQGAPQSTTPSTAQPSTATTAQPATPTQIADIVEQEFPKYSGGKDTLTQTQFGAWMASLRSASDPSATAESPEMKSWITQAFAQADTDKSKSVSKAELTAFLTKASG